MCRGARSAHGSPSTENRHSRRTPESRGKPPNRPAREPPSNVQRPRTGREEPQAPRLKTAPAATPPQPVREDLDPPGSNTSARPPPGVRTSSEPRGRPPPPHRPLGHRSWRERLNDAIPHERRNRCAPESHAPTTFLSRRTARHWPDRASHPGEHARKRQQGLRSRPPLRGAG